MNEKRKKLPPLCAKYGHPLNGSTRGVEQILEDYGALDRIAVALASQEQNNVALTGPAGCGKTSTVRKLAALIEEGRYARLAGRRVVELNIDLINQERDKRDLRFKHILDEAEYYNIIIYVDEAHRLSENSGPTNLLNTLKPYIASGGISMLISTTSEEFRRYIAKDRAMERRFQPVELKEPDYERLLLILERVARVRYPDTEITRAAIEETARLAALCAPERSEPARSLELLHYEVSAAQIKLPPGENVKLITEREARRAAALKTDNAVGGCD
ncbi:MAG: AAA family ATPase [Synergistaceae bacterium]|nr:AAA family ATPase [Synergistaceae bacterium]